MSPCLKTVGLLVLSLLVGCVHRGAPVDLSKVEAVDVLLVPGCPTRANGGLSKCLWFRAVWADEIWRQGRASRFVTSGGAVYNPYVEAVSLKRALMALGVPPNRILTETQARHTDENVGYSLALFGDSPPKSLGVASHALQAQIACRLARSWGTPCTAFPAPEEWLNGRIADRPPRIRVDPVKAADWREHREGEHDRSRDRREGFMPRARVYLAYLTWGRLFGRRPPTPPQPEPTSSSESP